MRPRASGRLIKLKGAARLRPSSALSFGSPMSAPELNTFLSLCLSSTYLKDHVQALANLFGYAAAPFDQFV